MFSFFRPRRASTRLCPSLQAHSLALMPLCGKVKFWYGRCPVTRSVENISRANGVCIIGLRLNQLGEH